MADLSITSGNSAISLNNGGISAGSASNAASSTTVKVVKEVVLTDKEKEEMLLCGLDPNNQDDIVKFRNMTSEEKAVLLVVENAPSVDASDENTPILEEISVQNSTGEQKSVEENHHVDIQIDTNSPEWKNKSDAEKFQFVLAAGTKAKIGEEKWNSLTERQRNAEVKKFFSAELSEHIPGWENMNSKEKLEKMSDILTLYSIAKNAGMDFSELLKLKKDNVEEYQNIVEQYYADGHVRIDLAKMGQTRQDQRSLDIEAHNAQLREFCNVAEDEPIENHGQQEYKFLQTLDPSNMTVYQKNKFELYKSLEEKLGKEVFSKLELGEKKLFDLLSDDEIKALSLETDDKGNINHYSRDNRHKINQAAAQKLLLSKKPEEIKEYLAGLSPEALVHIMAEIGKPENEANISEEFLTAFKEVVGTDYTTAAFNAYSILENRGKRSSKMQDFDSHNVLPGLENLGLPQELIGDVQRTMTSWYQRPAAVQAQVTAGEMGVKEYVAAGNEGIAERADYKETFEEVNYVYANSQNISDEIKQFYAQNSVEVLKSPEDRQAQADSLGKYKLDAFDKGVQKGYENIANGTASNSKTTSSSAQSNVTNPIAGDLQNTQFLSPKVQQAYNAFIKYDDKQIISHDEAIRMFQKLELNEQREFLSNLSSQQVSQIPITVCNAFPELIGTFIDIGKGIDIIQHCNMNTGNIAIKSMAKSKGSAKKQFNEWAANHTERLAKSTYEDLVAQGTIQVSKSKSFTART